MLRLGSLTFARGPSWGTRARRSEMMLRRASSETATVHGAKSVSVAANMSSRARE